MGSSSDNRNLILAAVLSMAVIFGWQALFPPPLPPEPAATGETGAVTAPTATGEATGSSDGQPTATAAEGQAGTVQDADATSRRIEIAGEAVTGSILLKGGRIDDLHLSEYRQTLDKSSDKVVLLSPTTDAQPYYVVYGWLRTAAGDPGPLPGANTPWSVADGARLAAGSPLRLSWDNGRGLIFHREIALDDRYMFTITQSVENTGTAPVELAPYGYVARRGIPENSTALYILHEGAVGMFDGELSEVDYDEILELQPNALEGGRVQAVPVAENGWLGFTDKYWMTTLAPASGQTFDAIYKAIPHSTQPEFRTEMRLPVMTVAPGRSAQIETRLFAGAKELGTIESYETDLGIDRFYDSIDWGWFYFLTKPIAKLLNWVHGLVGNMGFAIITLTLIVKAALFPLAYKSYVSMSKMKKLQPEMEKIKERAADDKQKLQQEMMALYKKEKVNPASGCLPILLQIPIFFALYKVIFVTLELRHAPFIGWIEDLSAPDPTSWLNLFGLLPYDVSWAPIFISIGVFPILMGITMWMQQKLNPAPTDATQAMIFAWMPWLFMFMLGSFASGLVIYWCANNIITFAQQYAIMRSQGVEVDFFGNIKRSFKRGAPPIKSEGPTAAPADDEDVSEDADEAAAPEAEADPAPKQNIPRSRRKKKKKGANPPVDTGFGSGSAPHGPGKKGRGDGDSAADGGGGGDAGGGGGGGDAGGGGGGGGDAGGGGGGGGD